MLVDGESGDVEEAVYEHQTQRASRLTIDKEAMELYFIDVSSRPLTVQVVFFKFHYFFRFSF